MSRFRSVSLMQLLQAIDSNSDSLHRSRGAARSLINELTHVGAALTSSNAGEYEPVIELAICRWVESLEHEAGAVRSNWYSIEASVPEFRSLLESGGPYSKVVRALVVEAVRDAEASFKVVSRQLDQLEAALRPHSATFPRLIGLQLRIERALEAMRGALLLWHGIGERLSPSGLASGAVTVVTLPHASHTHMDMAEIRSAGSASPSPTN